MRSLISPGRLIPVGMLALFFAVAGCDTNTTDQTSPLELVSPDGVRLAESMEELKGWIAPNINARSLRLGKSASGDFEVTRIEYFETEKQSAALVYYRSESGVEGNVGIVTEKAAGKNQAEPIKWKADCLGTCSDGNTGGCIVHASLDFGSGQVNFRCSCAGCTLVIEVIRD